MKTLKYKDYYMFDHPEQDEIIIFGGKEDLKQDEIKRVAKAFFEREDFELFKSEVFDVTGSIGWEFKYYHFTLSYGPNCMYDPRDRNYNETGPNQIRQS